MGISTDAARFLVSAVQGGAVFRSVLTIGRLETRLPAWFLRWLEKTTGAPLPVPIGDAAWNYVEPLLRMLGADRIEALDASAFEGSGIVHDLNEPVDVALHGRFDLVLDGGTLEHVFNVPVALRNCMEMVKPGGRLILVTPANNFCGHGFYQFSPELFFRTLAPENGFEVERIVACEAFPLGRWYRIEDPARVGRRVELVTAHRVLLFVQARRTTADAVFAAWPQQSDYQALWADRKRQAGRRARREGARRRDANDELQRILYRLCPPVAYRVRAWVDRYKARRCGLRSRRPGLARVRS